MLKDCFPFEFSALSHFLISLPIFLESEVPVLVMNKRRGSLEDFANHLRAVTACGTDFDGTLVPGSHWLMVRRKMRPEDQAADEAETFVFFTNPARTEEYDQAWLSRGLERAIRSGLTAGQAALLARKILPYPGAVELLASFPPSPTKRAAIISLGLKWVIEAWCSSHGLTGVEVYAQDFARDGNNGLKPGLIITDRGKGTCFRDFCQRHYLWTDDALILGDGWSERDLFDCGGLRVFVFPADDLQSERFESRRAAVSRLWSELDAVLIGNSLQPLVHFRCLAR
jgi:phosphoserine phosphatase